MLSWNETWIQNLSLKKNNWIKWKSTIKWEQTKGKAVFDVLKMNKITFHFYCNTFSVYFKKTIYKCKQFIHISYLLLNTYGVLWHLKHFSILAPISISNKQSWFIDSKIILVTYAEKTGNTETVSFPLKYATLSSQHISYRHRVWDNRDEPIKWEFKQSNMSLWNHVKGKNTIWRNLPHTSQYSLQEMSPWLHNRDAVAMFFLSLSVSFCALIIKA